MDVAINIFVAPSQCWSCGADTSIITNLMMDLAGEETAFCVGDLTDYPELAEEIATQIPPELGVGATKMRPSATMGRAYMSNGCAPCDAIFGMHYEIHARYDERHALTILPSAAAGWADLVEALNASDDGHLI
ncbi:hypothetical protein N5J77_27020 [Sphingobium yanoikuyae]|uniref:Uncharacterized protein n=1 Tax=Sphingobium yanoikuyae TaxID=13690 RepID=A0AA43BDX5_SPHYA|nr:hypothetical protein [Sphingobium yanoikuyae]MDH2134790.1 hypothetical protein [Sphingobium yanoikuyae]MDH2152856.1 hypothetical protein [Sphingobium yanoikuyae]MDH2170321.1 hypothetical protein [Sphingobium yanoikuyae]